LWKKESDMPIPKPPYAAEFRQQMVELVQAGRSAAQLSREFNVSATSIAKWVAQMAGDPGRTPPGREALSSAERQELVQLRRENKQLRQERDILAKATAWFAVKGDKTFVGSTNS
jgi:transposase